jgi:hypothetical protein
MVRKQGSRIIFHVAWILHHPLAALLVQWKDFLESQTKILMIFSNLFFPHLSNFSLKNRYFPDMINKKIEEIDNSIVMIIH